MRILVTGATGLLGTATVRAARAAGHDVVGSRHRSRKSSDIAWRDLELTDPESVMRAIDGMDVVVHTAYARSGSDTGEVNVTGAARVAEACAHAGIDLVHVSSDVVFAGDRTPGSAPYVEDDPVDPLAGYEYGREKADAELLVRELHPASVIVRTSLMYDLAGGSSLEQMVIASAEAGNPTVHFTDELRRPVHVTDVAEGILATISPDASGLGGDARLPGPGRAPTIHLVGPQLMSRHRLACSLAAHLGLDPRSMRPGRSRDVPGDRPATLDLSIELARRVLGWSPRELTSD